MPAAKPAEQPCPHHNCDRFYHRGYMEIMCLDCFAIIDTVRAPRRTNNCAVCGTATEEGYFCSGGCAAVAVIFLLMGLNGLIGWALHGGVVGALIGGLGSVITIAFTVGFLYPLKLLVSFLQAFIFMMLTMLYISGAIEDAEHVRARGGLLSGHYPRGSRVVADPLTAGEPLRRRHPRPVLPRLVCRLVSAHRGSLLVT